METEKTRNPTSTMAIAMQNPHLFTGTLARSLARSSNSSSKTLLLFGYHTRIVPRPISIPGPIPDLLTFTVAADIERGIDRDRSDIVEGRTGKPRSLSATRTCTQNDFMEENILSSSSTTTTTLSWPFQNLRWLIRISILQRTRHRTPRHPNPPCLIRLRIHEI